MKQELEQIRQPRPTGGHNTGDAQELEDVRDQIPDVSKTLELIDKTLKDEGCGCW